MLRMLGSSASGQVFAILEKCMLDTLGHIGDLIESSECVPWTDMRHSPDQPAPVPSSRLTRIGVFPIAANPLHWAHLIGGLIATKSFGLDKVIYVIAGDDPRKPFMASAKIRYQIARSVLRQFHPLFECSSIAQGGAACGEESLFRLLALNPGQRIHAFYIAGSDHAYREDPGSGRPDTIQKLENGVADCLRGSEKPPHTVSVVFLGRNGQRERKIETDLDVRWLKGPPVHTSSTAIRTALPDPAQWVKLSALPFAVFSSIRKNHLYQVCGRNAYPTPRRGRAFSAKGPKLRSGEWSRVTP